MFIIYLITNKINGKKHIGKTAQTLHKRWLKHTSEAAIGKRNYYLYRAMRKHGVNSFVIKEIDKAENHDVVVYREMFWIAALQTYRPDRGYNQTFGGEGGNMTPETCKKLSDALKGRPKSPEHIAKMREVSTGKKASPETKIKMSISRKGRKQSPEIVERRIAPLRGRKHTEESKRNMSEGHKGRVLSEETRATISAASMGKKHSEETIGKLKDLKKNAPRNIYGQFISKTTNITSFVEAF